MRCGKFKKFGGVLGLTALTVCLEYGVWNYSSLILVNASCQPCPILRVGAAKLKSDLQTTKWINLHIGLASVLQFASESDSEAGPSKSAVFPCRVLLSAFEVDESISLSAGLQILFFNHCFSFDFDLLRLLVNECIRPRPVHVGQQPVWSAGRIPDRGSDRFASACKTGPGRLHAPNQAACSWRRAHGEEIMTRANPCDPWIPFLLTNCIPIS